MKLSFVLCVFVIASQFYPATSIRVSEADSDAANSERLGVGRRLKLLGSMGASIDYRSNNYAFSASTSVSPTYFATLFSDDFGGRDGGLAAALAYAVDVSPDNWVHYARGEDIDDVLLDLLARGPTATTDASVTRGGGGLQGDAYANARGNFIAFSRAYVHLLDEAEQNGVDLASRSQARATAVSEKQSEELTVQRLYKNFYDRYQSEARVLAVVDATARDMEAAANQQATAETDRYLGGTQCARVWLRGEAGEGVEITDEDLLVRGVDLEIFECDSV